MYRRILRKAARTAQTYFPGFDDMKYSLQISYYNHQKRPFNRNFEVLSRFAPTNGAVFIDVGANWGQSIAAMRLYHPSVPIVAFEPGKATFAKLSRYVKDMDNVTLINCGLGKEAGRIELYTPVYNGYTFDGLSSTIREAAEQWLNHRRIFFFDRAKLKVVKEVIDLATLNSLGLTPCFMKIDVQGGEENVLLGGIETIRAHMPLLLIEQPPDTRLERLLEPLGYVACHYGDGVLRRGPGGGSDAFFVPEVRWGDLALPLE